MEHILNELEDLFQSLVRRMNKSEMEDFELVNWFTYMLKDSSLTKTQLQAVICLLIKPLTDSTNFIYK